MVFSLIDTNTNNYMILQSDGYITEGSVENAIELSIQVNNNTYNNNQGTVAIQDVSTGKYLRHAAGNLREDDFETNNIDFSWIFYKSSTTNIYYIFNFYNFGDRYSQVGFDGSHVDMRYHDDALRGWKVTGDTNSVSTISLPIPSSADWAPIPSSTPAPSTSSQFPKGLALFFLDGEGNVKFGDITVITNSGKIPASIIDQDA